jgi:hypothetical protein
MAAHGKILSGYSLLADRRADEREGASPLTWQAGRPHQADRRMVMSDATILENILRILVRNALDLPEAINVSHRQLMTL